MERLDKRRKLTIMIAIMGAMLFAAMNQTIVGTALPRIIAELGGMEYYTWVFTAYMLTSSITTILVGKLSDLYGRKPFLLIGIGVFIVGSFLSGTSATIVQLIAWRGLQGIGAGMVMSTAFTAIGDLFSPRERGRWNGLMGASFGLASVFGPTLGGYIVDHWPWHWVFWVFLPLGLVAFVLILVLFPKVERKATDPVDYFGSLFLTAALVPMLLAFSWAGTKYAWGSERIVDLFVVAAAALAIFLLIEWRVRAPVLPLFLFKNSIFTVSNLVGFVTGVSMFGAIMYVPYFIQGVLGYSATHSSFVTMPMTLSLVLGSAVGGQLTTRTGKYKLLALFGLLLLSAGLFLMSDLNVPTTSLHLVLLMIVVGVGLGLSMPVFTLTVQNAVEPKYLGVATSSAQFIRSLGGTVGVSVMGTVMSHRMQDKLAELSAAAGGNAAKLDPQATEHLKQLQNLQNLLDPDKLNELRASMPEQLLGLFDRIVAMMREALSYSLDGVFLSAAAVSVVAVLLTLFLKEIPLRLSDRRTRDHHADSAGPTAAMAAVGEPNTDR